MEKININEGSVIMAWMRSESEKKRVQDLTNLEDKRVAWATKMKAEGMTFQQALFTQIGGGFEGVALTKSMRLFYLRGPAPGEEGVEFCCEPLLAPQCRFEPYILSPEGFGGVLGLGKKGGIGYKLFITTGNDQNRTIEFMPAVQNMLDISEGQPFALLDSVRNKKEYNFVWEFGSPDRAKMEAIALRWAKLLTKPL